MVPRFLFGVKEEFMVNFLNLFLEILHNFFFFLLDIDYFYCVHVEVY